MRKYFLTKGVVFANVARGLVFGLATILVPSANAQGITSATSPSDIAVIICNIAGYMFEILIALSTVMVLVGAFIYLTAGESAEKVKTAHKTITYAAVGIIVALLAKSFPLIVASILGIDTLPGKC